jgi:phage terminase large subunit-like protein
MGTNASFDVHSICGRLHKRGQDILDGISCEENFLPIIYGSTQDDDISDPKVWAKCQPSLGHTITLADYETEYKKVVANPSKELYFRRLFCGQWISSSKCWLKAPDIGKCIVDKFPEGYEQLPCYIGFDIGPIWDISCAAFVFVDEANDCVYLDTMMWIPKQSAMGYQDSHGIPYWQWQQSGFIELVDSRTIGAAQKRMIAQAILAKAKTLSNVQQVCYDRYKASEVIDELTISGLQCEPIANTTLGLGLATVEFERRIIDNSIHFKQNDCLLWQLSHVAVTPDKAGNIKPDRPDATDTYEGSDAKKVDAVFAAMNAFSRACLHLMKKGGDDEAIEAWDGEIPYV